MMILWLILTALKEWPQHFLELGGEGHIYALRKLILL